ncbi:hypothetical protein SB783_48325, partial [Paraburkholderia sp. SIMBA_009]
SRNSRHSPSQGCAPLATLLSIKVEQIVAKEISQPNPQRDEGISVKTPQPDFNASSTDLKRNKIF